MRSQDALLNELAETISRAKALVFVIPDDTGFLTIQNYLFEQVKGIIEDSSNLMRRVMVFYDEEGSEPATDPLTSMDSRQREDDFLREIGAAISSELAAQEVSNIAFAVRTQLMEAYEPLLDALAQDQSWSVASHADTGLRRAGKGLITLESAIREYENLEPVERTWSRLHDSLEIRRLYCQFRRNILRQGTPGDFEALSSGLRQAAHRIAILRDRKIYPLMRISDRLPIRRLQKRILSWLEEGEDATQEQGRHLWSDLISFAELLVQVNHRQELWEHDRQVIGDWLNAHFPNSRANADPYTSKDTGKDGAQRAATTAAIADLEPLLGRSTTLDDLLFESDPQSLESFRQPLEEIFQQLNRPFETVDFSIP